MHLNDGRPVERAMLERIAQEWAILFGGVTVEGEVEGIWFDEDGTEYRDRSWKVSVICDNDLYRDARTAVMEVGRLLGQKAMYFEVRDFEGSRILKVE
jgi:hypothetical protein